MRNPRTPPAWSGRKPPPARGTAAGRARNCWSVSERPPDEPIRFASTTITDQYGDISSAFFPLIGLGDVLFISNQSR